MEILGSICGPMWLVFKKQPIPLFASSVQEIEQITELLVFQILLELTITVKPVRYLRLLMEDIYYGMIHCGMVKDVIFQQLTLVTDMDLSLIHI